MHVHDAGKQSVHYIKKFLKNEFCMCVRHVCLVHVEVRWWPAASGWAVVTPPPVPSARCTCSRMAGLLSF